jgi:signal peptide peptidase SppA
MKTYNHIMRAICSMPWAIQRSKLDAMLAFLFYKTQTGGNPVDAELRAELSAATSARSVARQAGSVAVLPLVGIISHRMSAMDEISGPGGTSTDKFSKAFAQAMADPNVKAIVIDIDSPGGSIDGVAELFDQIYSARGSKPITAISNTLMASAAYWIGVAADEVVVTPSGQVGSIGVYMVHEDWSKALEMKGVKTTYISAGKYKTEGNPDEPLTDEAKASLQKMVDDYYGMFTKAVAKGRGTKVSAVKSGFGQGRVVTAEEAVTLGMADRVATLDEVLKKFGVSSGVNGPQATLIESRQFTAEEIMPSIGATAAANSVEQELVDTPDPQSIAFDLELRRRLIEFAD